MTYLSSPYSRSCFSLSSYPPYSYSPNPTWSWLPPSWICSPAPPVWRLPSWTYSPAPPVWPTPSWAFCSPPFATRSPSWTTSSPLPPQMCKIHIHPSLSYNLVDPTVSRLQWDIISPPELARELSGKGILLPVKLSDEALYATEGGDITEIWIESDNPYLQAWIYQWGPIRLRRTPAEPKFSIRDVLDGIRKYLSFPLTRAEMKGLFEGGAHQSGVSAGAMLMKARAMRERDEFEWGVCSTDYTERGFRRSDVLGSYRRFQGMRLALQPGGTWKVLLGVLPGQVPRYI